MRNCSWGLLAVLVAGCGGSPFLSADAGSSGSRDAAVAPSADAGSHAGDAGISGGQDASSAASADVGRVSCRLEDPAAAVKLAGTQQEYDLADLAASDGKLAVAYFLNQADSHLMLVDAEQGLVLADLALVDVDNAVVPRTLDYAGGLFFVAHDFEATIATATSFTRAALYDEAGVSKGSSQTDGFVAISAARELSGGRVVALGRAESGEQPVFVNRYGSAGALTDSIELGRNARPKNEWDLAWRYLEDSGMACGAVSRDGKDLLALWELSAATATLRETAVELPTPTSNELGGFGCRIALGTSEVAVAVSDGMGGARLVWLAQDGAKVAGPVAFSAYKSALKYDVAANGRLTALAHLDDSSGSPHVVVKIYRAPGEAPVELSAEADLDLGTFDFTGRRVRLAPVGEGFAVAFDASIRNGQTDLYLRRILCE